MFLGGSERFVDARLNADRHSKLLDAEAWLKRQDALCLGACLSYSPQAHQSSCEKGSRYTKSRIDLNGFGGRLKGLFDIIRMKVSQGECIVGEIVQKIERAEAYGVGRPLDGNR